MAKTRYGKFMAEIKAVCEKYGYYCLVDGPPHKHEVTFCDLTDLRFKNFHSFITETMREVQVMRKLSDKPTDTLRRKLKKGNL